MYNFNDRNFAARLVQRVSENSCLIDATNEQTIGGSEIPGLIVGFAAGCLSAGLRSGDRILIACGIRPASTIAYLGAMYAGVVPVLIDKRTIESSGQLVLAKAGAKAFWTEDGEPCKWAEQTSIPQIAHSFPPVPSEAFPPATCLENDLAVLMPTSGSTGLPRLVMVSHGNLTANTEAIMVDAVVSLEPGK